MKEHVKYKTDLRERLLEFSVHIIALASKLPRTPAGFAVANQVIRSATSVGANCEEAQDALSRADFLRTMNIALKESRETLYWLQVIERSNLLPENLVSSELREANELVAILSSSVKRLKNVP
ncbi:MAG: four helix bundle protein [bacterium]|nr:four helix bundle protein [bacterium]